MPTPEQNKETVATFAREVFGSKDLDHADAWLADDFVEHKVFPGTTRDKHGAIDSYRIFFAASPDMTVAGDASQRRRQVWTSWGSSMASGSRPV